MKGKLKTLVAASFALMFGTAAAAGPICPPMPDCEARYLECYDTYGDENYCWPIIEQCIKDMCYDPGWPSDPP